MKLFIYVPTRGRILDQKSMRFLRLKECKDRVAFVVPQCEALAFKRKYSWAKVKVVKDEWKIGTISQYIIESKGRYKVLIDDDFQLLRRRNKLSVSQKGGVATDKDVRLLFARVKYWLRKGFAHGGVSLRQTNHFCKDAWYKFNSRVSGFMFFDSRVVRQEGIRFDAVQERQDFHMTLSLLELGYSNVVDYEFAVGQYIQGTNAAGGCSRYRTPVFLLEQAERLAQLHPKTVRVVFKQPKVAEATKSMLTDKGIPDVRIQWVKSLGLRSAERKVTKPYRCVRV